MKRTAFEAIDGLIEADNQEMHSDNIEEVIDSDDNDIEGLIDSDNQNIDEQMFENEEGSIDSDNDSAFDDWEKNQLMVYRKRHFNPIVPDYSSETSDEETNTLGNIPLEWYDDYPHIGYNVEGKKIMKPAQGDDLDKFLALMDKEEWKSVHVNGQKFTLNQEQLEILKRIQNRQFPHLDFDPYQPTVEWFTSKTEVMPLSAAPEPKRRFVPSQWEAQKIMKIARAIKDGLILPKKPEPKTKEFYDLWSSANDVVLKDRIKAPKLALPKTEESYNPPEEYLLDKNEEQSWLDTDPSDRKTNFLPKKYPALRKVPGYNKFIEERFERCLDLYLCPRIVRQRFDMDPETLLPKLPDPKELQPFPSRLSIVYKGHKGRIRTFDIDPTGQWMASGGQDNQLKIWEIISGRCLESVQFDSEIFSVSWNPKQSINLVAIACKENVFMLSPKSISADQGATEEIIAECIAQNPQVNSTVKWIVPADSEKALGYCVIIKTPEQVSSVTWHRKGDYFATTCPQATTTSVLIHQLSKKHSQGPFKKSPGIVQKVLFHPSKPILFVATQQYVRVYNLTKQELVKKLIPGAKWISSIDIHAQGENLIVGSFDGKLYWFDMDLSVKPYKTLAYHKKAIRQASYHPRYPLFASASDDGSVLLFHGMVYNDLSQNPLIVPLKSIKAHEQVEHLGVLDCKFHPTQPWILTSGADGYLKLFV